MHRRKPWQFQMLSLTLAILLPCGLGGCPQATLDELVQPLLDELASPPALDPSENETDSGLDDPDPGHFDSTDAGDDPVGEDADEPVAESADEPAEDPNPITGTPGGAATGVEVPDVIGAGLPGLETMPAGERAFDFDLPADWAREDAGNVIIAHLDTGGFHRNDKYIYVLGMEPVNGSVELTFNDIWQRELVNGWIKLINPGAGFESPAPPQPLRRRLPSGLVVWFEGGRATFEPVGYGYARLFLIEAGDQVLPVLGLMGTTVLGPGASDHNVFEEFLQSLRPKYAIPTQALFSADQLAGTWGLTITALLAS